MKSELMIPGSGWIRSAALAALVAVGVAGCKVEEAPPPPLPAEEVFVTMQGALPLDFVMEQLPEGGLVPSANLPETELVRGYRVDRYLIDGATTEVVWIHDPATGFPATDEARTRLNPVIFRNGQMDGWGWEHFDGRVAEWGIVDRSKSSASDVDTGAGESQGEEVAESAVDADAVGATPEAAGANSTEEVETFDF